MNFFGQYFGSYFAGYFGAAGGMRAEPDPSTVDDLLGAVQARFEATAALDPIAGGIYTKEAPRNLAPGLAYVVVEERGARLVRTTDTSKIHDTRLVFKIYEDDADAAGQYGDALTAAYQGRNLEFRQGFSNALVRHDRRHEKDPWWGMKGKDVWYLSVEFQCRVLRS